MMPSREQSARDESRALSFFMEALLTYTFEEGGSLAAIDLVVTYGQSHTKGYHLMFTDYDSTVVDPLPEADKTYEDMEDDMLQKVEEIEKQLGAVEGSEAEEAK